VPRVLRRPDESAARALLAACGLPSADLAAPDFADFFYCGPQRAPVGVVGVAFHGRVALLRSLAVARRSRGRGVGCALVAAAERHAWAHERCAIYLLTDSARAFFSDRGYALIDRGDAPAAIRNSSEFAHLCPASAALMVKRRPSGPAA
jgi:amino-acid N-acetyltransferase